MNDFPQPVFDINAELEAAFNRLRFVELTPNTRHTSADPDSNARRDQRRDWRPQERGFEDQPQGREHRETDVENSRLPNVAPWPARPGPLGTGGTRKDQLARRGQQQHHWVRPLGALFSVAVISGFVVSHMMF